MFFGIGIYNPKTETNVGTLWRTAVQLGAVEVFTIGRRYKKQSSDTYKTERHIPLRHYFSMEEFLKSRPYGAVLVGIEIGGIPLSKFSHPKQAIYLLGAEDGGLPQRIIEVCNTVVSLEAVRQLSFNVAVAGSIVMYHRCFINRRLEST